MRHTISMPPVTGLCLAVWCVTNFLPTGLASAADAPSTDAVRAAIAKSIPLLELGAKGSLEQRKQCFTCHNQGLPIQALMVARSRGFKIDDENLKTQVQFVADFLARNKANYLAGKGQGGQIDTAGYALWALDNGDHWQPQSKRPPSEQSLFTSSYVALRGLKTYGTPEQRERIDARQARVTKWLLETVPAETEDHVFRLRALRLVAAPDADLRHANDALLGAQREDGGWSQLPDLASDAYATSSALVALHEAGNLAIDSDAYRKGISYLISQQKPDGSWHVVSRSIPFQTYFESGYPHGKDQFISISAAGWATTALALSLPAVPSP
jgi:hypothetical protein